MLALSWSGGKDSALALEALRLEGPGPALLLSTVDPERGVIAHHQTPLELLRRQAAATGLPLVEIEVPPEAANVTYESRMVEAFEGPLAAVTEVAFGDLFLEDLRSYRESRMESIGRAARFPLWGRDTGELAEDFAGRFQATVCSVDREQLPEARPGVPFDLAFLRTLPEGADPCGERGEFHTFVHGGPVFSEPVEFEPGGLEDTFEGRFAHALMRVPEF